MARRRKKYTRDHLGRFAPEPTPPPSSTSSPPTSISSASHKTSTFATGVLPTSIKPRPPTSIKPRPPTSRANPSQRTTTRAPVLPSSSKGPIGPTSSKGLKNLWAPKFVIHVDTDSDKDDKKAVAAAMKQGKQAAALEKAREKGKQPAALEKSREKGKEAAVHAVKGVSSRGLQLKQMDLREKLEYAKVKIASLERKLERREEILDMYEEDMKRLKVEIASLKRKKA